MKKLTFILLVIFVGSFLSCSRNLINSQESVELSAITMYINNDGYVLQEVEVTNQETGIKYSNRHRGWGHEFFDASYNSYRYLIIGNLPQGNYYISKVTGWTLFKEQKGRKIFSIDIPSDIIPFKLNTSEIFYLGDIKLFILKNNDQKQKYEKYKDLYKKDKPKLSTFKTRHIGKDGDSIIVDEEVDCGMIYIYYPENNYRITMRPVEKPFLDFLSSKKGTGWSDIANRQAQEKKIINDNKTMTIRGVVFEPRTAVTVENILSIDIPNGWTSEKWEIKKTNSTSYIFSDKKPEFTPSVTVKFEDDNGDKFESIKETYMKRIYGKNADQAKEQIILYKYLDKKASKKYVSFGSGSFVGSSLICFYHYNDINKTVIVWVNLVYVNLFTDVEWEYILKNSVNILISSHQI